MEKCFPRREAKAHVMVLRREDVWAAQKQQGSKDGCSSLGKAKSRACVRKQGGARPKACKVCQKAWSRGMP